MHPFARARERTRALNAAKMDRIFAKPFVDALEGHIDAVEVLCRQPGSLTSVASASWDGGMYVFVSLLLAVWRGVEGSKIEFCLICVVAILLHNLSQRTKLVDVPHAHKGKVSGLCFTGNDRLLSCGMDRNIKLWDVAGGTTSPDTVRI